MKKQIISEPSNPIAHICINKSRVKIYDKETDPKIYLTKKTEFQIELFNPTQDTILAKIILNGTAISQGGLVLKPGQRVFLDRYIDVAKKFLFDTYEVSKSEEVKKAIEKNGDFKVEFYRERKFSRYILGGGITTSHTGGCYGGPITLTNTPIIGTSNSGNHVKGTSSGTLNLTSLNAYSTNINNTSNSNITPTAFYSSSVDYNINGVYDGATTMDWMSQEKDLSEPEPIKDSPKTKGILNKLRSKTIETGRVEEGSNSDQKLKTVSMDFEYFAFHTVEYKMLPVSQKVNTVEDLNVKRYCTGCGAKTAKTDNFCAKCGKRV